jgi:hypothetical protein
MIEIYKQCLREDKETVFYLVDATGPKHFKVRECANQINSPNMPISASAITPLLHYSNAPVPKFASGAFLGGISKPSCGAGL